MSAREFNTIDGADYHAQLQAEGKFVIYDPMAEPHWNANRDRVERSLKRVVSRLRTPALRSEIKHYINALSERANKPAEYHAEDVDDARHDLMLIAEIGDTLESANNRDEPRPRKSQLAAPSQPS